MQMHKLTKPLAKNVPANRPAVRLNHLTSKPSPHNVMRIPLKKPLQSRPSKSEIEAKRENEKKLMALPQTEIFEYENGLRLSREAFVEHLSTKEQGIIIRFVNNLPMVQFFSGHTKVVNYDGDNIPLKLAWYKWGMTKRESIEMEEHEIWLMNFLYEDSWRDRLGELFKSSEPATTLSKRLEREYQLQPIFPKKTNIFTALNTVPFEDVKAVIIGQDPYH